MRRHLLSLLLPATVLAIGAAPASGSTLHRVGSLPLIPSGSRVLGGLSGTTPLRVIVALQPRDPLALAAYAAGVSEPGSGEYHDYLTVSQFAARFGATPAAIDAVRTSLQAHGLTPSAVSWDGLSISVNGTATALGTAFSTGFRRLALPGGRTAYANTSAPAVAADVAADVQAIMGLDDVAHEQPLDLAVSHARVPHAAVAHAASSAVTPCAPATAQAQSPDGGGYTIDQIASIYGFDGIYGAGDEGAGQTIGVLELEGNFPADITEFQSCYGITPTPTESNVAYQQVDGGGGTPTVSNEDGLETELDVENVIGLAPDVNVTVYQAPNDGKGPYDAYQTMIAGSSRPNVISTSWGECEPDLGASAAQAENTLFEEAATQGQTVVAASGDDGAQDCFGDGTATEDVAAVDDPGSQPFVTGVGGTSISSASPLIQTVWNNGARGAGASGGGDSILWTMPSAQSSADAGVGVINSESSATCSGTYCREVPDVSADADPASGYVIFYGDGGLLDSGGSWMTIGGTSGAAPVWAALIALANASSSCTAPVGFANRMLYGAAGSSYGTYFNDITSGDNDWLDANGGRFTALTGYDQASGLGTPIASALVPALCGGPVTLTAPAAQSSTTVSTVHLQLPASAASGAITFAATGLPPGLSIGSSTGVISGTPTTVGSYTVTATAATATQSVSAKFDWTVSEIGSVKLATISDRVGQVRRATSLQLRASDSTGAAITYLAAGLPRGLTLARGTGAITGTPTAAGRYKVGIAATATGFLNAYAAFTWTVGARPSLTRASVTGVSGGRPALAFRVASGVDAPGVHTIMLRLPSGLSFALRGSALARLVSVVTTSGSRPAHTVSLSGGTLTIAARSAQSAIQVRIAAPGLRAAGRVGRTVTVTVGDASGLATRLSTALRSS